MRNHRGLVAVACALLLSATVPAQQLADDAPEMPLAALGTAFTYQGQLLDGGSPANGTYDLQLRLWDAVSGGGQVGGAVMKEDLNVVDGLFTVDVDFGANVFTGQALWLGIAVRPGASTGAFTILSPRQPLNPAPFADYARAGVATDVQCAGCVSVPDLAGGAASSGQVLTATGASSMAWQAPAGATGSGSPGQVAFWSGASTLSGSNNLFWDGANGRLGVGTTAPTSTLSAAGGVAVDQNNANDGTLQSGALLFGWASTGEAILSKRTPGGNQYGLDFFTYYLPRMSITNQGYVGIGTTSPTQELTLTGNLAMPGTAATSGTPTSGVLMLGPGQFLHSYGFYNTFVGAASGNFTMGGSGDEGTDNTGIGFKSLNANSTGYYNTGLGAWSLVLNDVGYHDTAVGAWSLSNNTSGFGNTGVGAKSLTANQDGWSNTAVGDESLAGNQSGKMNTAAGSRSLHDNLGGSSNTAVGADSLGHNTSGAANTAVGWSSLALGYSGSYNTAIGGLSLWRSFGDRNTATGYDSLSNLSYGDENLAIGFWAGYYLDEGSHNIYLGNSGWGTESNTMRLGQYQTSTYVAGIWGSTSSGGTPVYVDSGGHLGTLTSSLRSKKDVHDMGETSSRLMKLRPVTFHYKAQPDGPLQYGLIAEEVDDVMPELVIRDATGQVESVAYHEMPAILLNELQKQQATVRAQQDEIEALRTAIADAGDRDSRREVALETLRREVAELRRLILSAGREASPPRR